MNAQGAVADGPGRTGPTAGADLVEDVLRRLELARGTAGPAVLPFAARCVEYLDHLHEHVTDPPWSTGDTTWHHGYPASPPA
ncbi:hypothetical protein QMZ92_01650 [Streptomyces sp. HNM0645]|uniref:hypothetical protein n=1 Tax=Streptomyces sp. HNM0645 TaxID=2782343 RepID=UPI0024B6D805|nr:hypothetical protein [Streptomyces sp. HNM0645]MDI9883136.1 hypothetical protein [Streptomyces sp. HNM0645]